MDIATFIRILATLIVFYCCIRLYLNLRKERVEVSRTISDMLKAAMKLSEDDREERDNLLRRVAALWDLGLGDSVGSCQSLPQELVPVFVELFKTNSTSCTGWRKVIHDRHFGGNRSSEK